MADDPLLVAQDVLGHTFADPDHLTLALTHASEASVRLGSNERLEFLGDAILGMVVCEHLFNTYEDLLEGELTKIKSAVVSRDTCAKVTTELKLDRLLRLGKGMRERGEVPRSLAAGLFEALIGAIYLDGGLEPARRFILRVLKPRIQRAVRSGHQYNFKAVLQQAIQERHGEVPQYVLLDEKGPDHSKCFETCVEIGARRFQAAWGASKKRAEQKAALNALIELNLARQEEGGEIVLLEESERGEPVA